jgi:hypothetical protein
VILYLQAAPSVEEVSTFFLAEGELVGEIISLVEAESVVPDWLRTLALRTVAIQVPTTWISISMCGWLRVFG